MTRILTQNEGQSTKRFEGTSVYRWSVENICFHRFAGSDQSLVRFGQLVEGSFVHTRNQTVN